MRRFTSRSKRWVGLAVVVGAGLLLAACSAENNGQNSLRPKGPAAQKIDNLFTPVFFVSVEELEDIPDADAGVDDPDQILRLRADISVERDSQKGIVIGRGGRVLKDAGTAARQELETLLGVRVYLETRVRVERDWQRRDHALDRLGY